MRVIPMLLIPAVLSSAGICAAATIHVPGDFPSIQEGIDAAVDGDTVLVADGTYTGDGNREIDFGGKAVVLVSENGPEATIIDCADTLVIFENGFYFHSGEDTNSVVQGFTIRNGHRDRGGGIFCESSSPKIRGNVIENCASEINGGGIFLSGSSALILDNTISGNTTPGKGGGVYCENSSILVRGNTIEANTSNSRGGGIASEVSAITIEGNIVSDNSASWRGGGIYIGEYSIPVIVDNIVSGNQQTNVMSEISGGGGIYCDADTSVILTGNTISSNSAIGDGGGIYFLFGSYHVLSDNIIAENSSGAYGGGIIFKRCNADLENCSVFGNESSIMGGGIYADQGTRQTTYTDCTFAENEAQSGGGLFQHDSAPLFTRCVFRDNHARFRGGGFNCGASEPVFTGCVFRGNSSVQYGGAIFSKGSDPLLEKCTVVGNTSSGGGGFLTQGLYHNPVIVNSILWNNSPDEILVVAGEITVSYSDVQDGWEGEGNIDLPPRFIDYPAGNLHLQADSPCVDAGDPLSGVPVGGGCVIDMGAYEFWKGFNCRKFSLPFQPD